MTFRKTRLGALDWLGNADPGFLLNLQAPTKTTKITKIQTFKAPTKPPSSGFSHTPSLEVQPDMARQQRRARPELGSFGHGFDVGVKVSHNQIPFKRRRIREGWNLCVITLWQPGESRKHCDNLRPFRRQGKMVWSCGCTKTSSRHLSDGLFCAMF